MMCPRVEVYYRNADRRGGKMSEQASLRTAMCAGSQSEYGGG